MSEDSASIEFKLKTEYIELDNLLRAAELVECGPEAKQHIKAGLVRVNNLVEIRVRRKLRPGDFVEYAGHEVKVVA